MDRNVCLGYCGEDGLTSLSARRAWIEIPPVDTSSVSKSVALRKESVDRNYKFLVFDCIQGRVALRKESVDRNKSAKGLIATNAVALRKESVDRNPLFIIPYGGLAPVALRKESVDRNDFAISAAPGYHKSLSARRAWIEILGTFTISQSVSSLSARRAWIEISTVLYLTR